MNKLWLLIAALVVLNAGTAVAENSSVGDTMEEGLGHMYSGVNDRSREERGQAIHERQTEDHLQRVERSSGSSERLREEQRYRRTHPN